MENKISRKDDKSLYQPKIHSERIRALYQLKLATGKPMTVLLDRAIRDLAESYSTEIYPAEEPTLESIDVETWHEILEYRELLDRLDYLACLEEIEEIKRKDFGKP